MLFLETSKGFVPWNGEPIDGKRHPLNIEDLWSKEALAELRLFLPERAPIPEGKIVTGETVGREGGKVVVIYQLEDAPPPPPPPRDVFAEIDAIKLRLDALEAKAVVEAKA